MNTKEHGLWQHKTHTGVKRSCGASHILTVSPVVATISAIWLGRPRMGLFPHTGLQDELRRNNKTQLVHCMTSKQLILKWDMKRSKSGGGNINIYIYVMLCWDCNNYLETIYIYMLGGSRYNQWLIFINSCSCDLLWKWVINLILCTG